MHVRMRPCVKVLYRIRTNTGGGAAGGSVERDKELINQSGGCRRKKDDWGLERVDDECTQFRYTQLRILASVLGLPVRQHHSRQLEVRLT